VHPCAGGVICDWKNITAIKVPLDDRAQI